MKIDDFISETIEGIALGIIKANEKLNKKNCYVNLPKAVVRGKDESSIVVAEVAPPEDNSTRLVEKVRFDVSVVVEESTKTSGKAGVGISILNLSTEGASDSGSSNASRVSFSIPVVFPTAIIEPKGDA